MMVVNVDRDTVGMVLNVTVSIEILISLTRILSFVRNSAAASLHFFHASTSWIYMFMYYL